jgi:hypothetical protein
MPNSRAPFRPFAFLTFLITMSAAAHAQATRTRASGVGDDVNFGNNRFAGNGGSSTVTLIGTQTHDSGQQ